MARFETVTRYSLDDEPVEVQVVSVANVHAYAKEIKRQLDLYDARRVQGTNDVHEVLDRLLEWSNWRED